MTDLERREAADAAERARTADASTDHARPAVSRALTAAARDGAAGLVDLLAAAGEDESRAKVVRGLQRTSGNRAVALMLQRQSAPNGSTRFIADIVGHASPRWRSARDAEEAARRNRLLAERRAAAVRAALVRHARSEFRDDPDIGFEFDVSYRDPHESEETHIVGSDARGSRDARARGQRPSADEEYDRRVDVTVRISNRRAVNAPYSTRRRIPSVTTDWAVAITAIAGGGVGAGWAMLELRLRNRRTDQEAKAHSLILGGTTPEFASGGAADPNKLKWVSFVTDEPVNWNDFKRTSVRVDYWGVGAYRWGADQTYVSFPSFGRGAERLDLHGWATGASTPGIAAWSKAGRLSVPAIPPPAMEDVGEPNPVEIVETDEQYVPLHFETGDARLTASDQAALEEIVRRSAADFRNARERRRTR